MLRIHCCFAGDGRCVICDSYVRPCTLVRICDECNYGSYQVNYFFYTCDGRCVICDSYVRPCTLVRICDECNYGSYQGRCVICGGSGVSDAYYCKECTIMEKDRDGCPKIGRCVICGGSGVSDAYYCKECTIMEKDRDGCPKIVNLGSAKTDLFYERKKYGFKKTA
ncbi:unnamed protein product [Gongylonema pulchrum]|uniref:PHD finger-like domain-containing protein 5A n=1 Tax=Gongylonema pulchrum TaxID=637853 RepID=A0A3P7QEP3_9BILA|nr:unnamed protein product [Gongylonema pulchrum]